MPVDLTFQTTHTLTAETDGVEIRLPVSFGTTVRNDRNQANINVTPDTTDPLDELFRNFVSEGAIDFVVLFLPYGREGTMTVEGIGTVFRTDTGAYDTINTGSALLVYDTREPELVFSDLPTLYEPGDLTSADFVVGFNRNVTFDVSDPGNADTVFLFDGPYFGSAPGLYRYTGTGQPRLPLPADLMTATEWALMRRNDYGKYFAVRFSQVPDIARGTLNITLKADVPVTPDNEDSLLAVSAPPPVPLQQQQSPPIIEKIVTQFLTLTEDFEVTINITGPNATEATVKGLADKSYYEFDQANQELIIRGNARKLVTDAVWRCEARRNNRIATPVNQIYNYVELAPVVSSLGKQDVFVGANNEILIPISNGPSDGNVTTELIGLDHELVDNVGDGMNTHMRIFGTPPVNVNFGIDEGSFSVMGTNTGGDNTAITEFRTSEGEEPSWSNIPNPPSTIYVGDSYRVVLSNYVTGIPIPVITRQSGTIPPGLLLAADYDLEGTFTASGTYRPQFRAENAVGNDDSEILVFNVSTPIAPQLIRTINNNDYYTEAGDILDSNHTIITLDLRFNLGTPTGTPSLTGTLATSGIFEFDTNALVIPSGTHVDDLIGNSYTGTVVITNIAGSAESNEFTLTFLSI